MNILLLVSTYQVTYQVYCTILYNIDTVPDSLNLKGKKSKIWLILPVVFYNMINFFIIVVVLQKCLLFISFEHSDYEEIQAQALSSPNFLTTYSLKSQL